MSTAMTAPTPLEGEVIPPGAILLVASDLFRKEGFGDGDMLDDLLEDAGFDPMAEKPVEDDMFDAESFCHAVLSELVASRVRGLLPAGALTLHASRAHNPIRADDTPENRAALEGVRFFVAADEIAATAAAMAEGFVPRATGVRL